MRIVLATEELAAIGGSQTYLVTVGEQLSRLGHDVLLAANVRAEMTRIAEARGLRVLAPEALPDVCDAVLAQDAPAAYELAARYPAARRLYVAHSTEAALQLPPQEPGVIASVVALNDRVAAHLAGLGHAPPVHRLRQPVDLARFGRLADRPGDRIRTVVAFGNVQGGEALRRLRNVVEGRGSALSVVGRQGEVSEDPDIELSRADVVAGIGRCALEGMAARRAVYVTGPVGTDGWITPKSYAAIEADGFSGRATQARLDEDDLRAALDDWSPELGDAGRELAYRHHDAADHARALVSRWSEMEAPRQPVDAPLGELARLTRAQAAAESRLFAVSAELRRASRERDELVDEADRLRTQLLELGDRFGELTATRRYRLAGALVKPLDLAREGRRRAGGSGPFDRV